ncbi:MAG: site-specific integrase, partial [Candidatus Saccharibacteria bacterium]|nr:site-specific integrase [Rhodoferax sp.]
MGYGDGLRRKPGGIWYWRWVVPADVRQVFGAQEVQRSLETASKRDAVRQSLAFRLAVAGFLEAARAGRAVDKDKMLAGLAAAKKKLSADDAAAEVEAEIFGAHSARVAALEQLVQARHEHKLQVAAVVGTTIEALTDKPGPLLTVAIDAYLNERRTARAWTPKTLERWQVTFRLLLDGVGDQPITQVTRESLNGLLARLQRLPSNAGKKVELAGMTFLALTEPGGKFGPVLADETVNGHMSRISGFFKWAHRVEEYGLRKNPASGLLISKPERVKRKPFSDDQLLALFSHESWRTRTFLHPHYFWLMPLALLSGMRLNEACQLTLNDFTQVDGVKIIKCANLDDSQVQARKPVEPEDEAAPGVAKRGKGDNSTRQVPIHAELIRLGLLRWVAMLRAAGETQLFPELKPSRDGHGQAPSRWFQGYRSTCGIEGTQVYVFHSFRHHFINRRLKAKVLPHDIAAIVGHETGLITIDIYGQDFDMVELQKVVNAVGFPEVVKALIPTVEEVRFTKVKRRPPSRLGARKSRASRISDAAARKVPKGL